MTFLDIWKAYNIRYGIFEQIAKEFNYNSKIKEYEDSLSNVEGHFCFGQVYVLKRLTEIFNFQNLCEIGSLYGKSATIFAKNSLAGAKIHWPGRKFIVLTLLNILLMGSGQ